MPIEDGLPNIPSMLDGTVTVTATQSTSQHTVPSNTNKIITNSQYISSHDDSKLVTVRNASQSSPSTQQSSSQSSPMRIVHPSPSMPSSSSSSMDGEINRKKRSRTSVSSHSYHSSTSSSSDTDDDERPVSKRHQTWSDTDNESVTSHENKDNIITIKYGEHAIRVLTVEDGSRVVVAKDFLLLTGISKENCARTTKNLVEGRDKKMMHVPSNYCMNKGQNAVVLTSSGLSQLIITSRRLKQSATLLAWIKQTLMPTLQQTNTNNNNNNKQSPSQPQTQPQPQAKAQGQNQNIVSNTTSRSVVRAVRSPRVSPSTSPCPKPTALVQSPSSSFSPYCRSPSSSSSSSSSPPRPTLARLSSADSMSDSSSSTPGSPITSTFQELAAAADLMLIAPNATATTAATTTTPVFGMKQMGPTPFQMPPRLVGMGMGAPTPFSFPYRLPLNLPSMAAKPTFTYLSGSMFSAGA